MRNPIRITLGGYGPPTTTCSRGMKVLGDSVAEQFDKEVSIHYVWNVMDFGYKAADLLWMAEDGILSATYQSTSYIADRVPELDFVDLLFLFDNITQARAAIDGAGPGRLAQLLKPLVRLHAMDAVAGLRDFDPLEKLVPRLVPGVRAALLPVVESALSEIGRAATRRRVIHGDFHAGQILLDGGGDAWLLDFDDMAVGDPAADIGNFCAHLATSDATSQAAPLAAMRHWLSVTFSAYGLAGGDANPALADAYGRIALVRRALKAHEKGNVDLLHGMRRDQ